MKMRYLTFLFLLFVGISTLNFAVAAENPPADSGKAEPTSDSSPKGLLEVAGDLLGKLAWPALALLVFQQLKKPAIQLLQNIAEKSKDARSIKISEFSIEVNSTEDFKEVSGKLGRPTAIMGSPDLFRLVCKASNTMLSKSTKVMNLPAGCLVQVSTKEASESGDIAVAEALTYIPGLNIDVPDWDKVAEESVVTFRPVPLPGT